MVSNGLSGRTQPFGSLGFINVDGGYVKVFDQQFHNKPTAAGPGKPTVLFRDQRQVPPFQSPKTTNDSTSTVTTHAAAHEHGVIIAIGDELKGSFDCRFVQRVPRIHRFTVKVGKPKKLDGDGVIVAKVHDLVGGFLGGEPKDRLEVELFEERKVDGGRLAQTIKSPFHGAKI